MEKTKKINVGVVGLGGRGYSLLKNVILIMEDVNVLYVCDLDKKRVKKAAKTVIEQKGNTPIETDNYMDILNCKDIDAVFILSAWESHIEIALKTMKAGKYAAVEVGGAYSVRDCQRLVEAYEETKIPCMLLENACYARTELMLLNMVRQGIFGEIVHCEGGYHHDLRKEISYGIENGHYRLRNYIHRNCENYPTHELGPIAKILNINRGNRILTLTSVASKAEGLSSYIAKEKPDDLNLVNTKFAQGDVVTTILKCSQGQTIVLTLDTTLPGYYSRGLVIKGTKAAYNEENNSVYIDEVDNSLEFKWHKKWGNAKEYRKDYEHPIWEEYEKAGIKKGHEGIDWLVMRAFVESVKAKTNTPIDIYDMATWMCVSALSEKSISLGGAPVPFPDFTNGKWLNPGKENESKFSLDKVVIDLSVKV